MSSSSNTTNQPSKSPNPSKLVKKFLGKGSAMSEPREPKSAATINNNIFLLNKIITSPFHQKVGLISGADDRHYHVPFDLLRNKTTKASLSTKPKRKQHKFNRPPPQLSSSFSNRGEASRVDQELNSKLEDQFVRINSELEESCQNEDDYDEDDYNDEDDDGGEEDTDNEEENEKLYSPNTININTFNMNQIQLMNVLNKLLIDKEKPTVATTALPSNDIEISYRQKMPPLTALQHQQTISAAVNRAAEIDSSNNRRKPRKFPSSNALLGTTLRSVGDSSTTATRPSSSSSNDSSLSRTLSLGKNVKNRAATTTNASQCESTPNCLPFNTLSTKISYKSEKKHHPSHRSAKKYVTSKQLDRVKEKTVRAIESLSLKNFDMDLDEEDKSSAHVFHCIYKILNYYKKMNAEVSTGRRKERFDEFESNSKNFMNWLIANNCDKRKAKASQVSSYSVVASESLETANATVSTTISSGMDVSKPEYFVSHRKTMGNRTQLQGNRLDENTVATRLLSLSVDDEADELEMSSARNKSLPVHLYDTNSQINPEVKESRGYSLDNIDFEYLKISHSGKFEEDISTLANLKNSLLDKNNRIIIMANKIEELNRKCGLYQRRINALITNKRNNKKNSIKYKMKFKVITRSDYNAVKLKLQTYEEDFQLENKEKLFLRGKMEELNCKITRLKSQLKQEREKGKNNANFSSLNSENLKSFSSLDRALDELF